MTTLPACLQPRPGLQVFGAVPPGCFGFFVENDESDPLLKHGEFAIIDTSITDPEDGALFLIEWNRGAREIVEANLRYNALSHRRTSRTPDGVSPPEWWVGAFRRPRSLHEINEALARRHVLRTVDGPYEASHLASKLIGKVVGVLAPDRHSREELMRRADVATCPAHILATGYGAKAAGYIEPAGSKSYREGGGP